MMLADVCLESGNESCSVVFNSATSWTIQVRILEWIAILFSRGSSQPRDQIALWADSLPAEPQGKPANTGVSSLSLLQRIFPTQESNRGLLHCRRILYQLSYLYYVMFLLYSIHWEFLITKGCWILSNTFSVLI